VTRRRPDELDTNADFFRIGHVGAAAEAEIENRRLVIWDQVQQPLALVHDLQASVDRAGVAIDRLGIDAACIASSRVNSIANTACAVSGLMKSLSALTTSFCTAFAVTPKCLPMAA
jgi:hypothetical protein